eukprot:12399451-Karenia_brevis.AAC.1
MAQTHHWCNMAQAKARQCRRVIGAVGSASRRTRPQWTCSAARRTGSAGHAMRASSNRSRVMLRQMEF